MEKSTSIWNVAKELEEKLGREPTDEELEDELRERLKKEGA